MPQISVALFFIILGTALAHAAKPHIILVMTDDQGWAQTGYYQHPRLETPHLDAMAANGLRLDRFYAAAPVCSPTRASVLTGRTNMRTGVNSHGHALRIQERTLAQALKSIGYATGHFGKWHLNGFRGPGVPIFADDPHGPGAFGFDHWLSVSNFFDRDPVMSRDGSFEPFQGDSSEIIVREALAFLARQVEAAKPTFSVIWYGTPHSPFRASPQDCLPFSDLDQASQHQLGELVAMDRSVGHLRSGLRDLGIAKDTLIWFCSDNGGLSKIRPSSVGSLRGFKGSLYEGGLRVPGIIEWPATITPGRTTTFPAVTMDIFPTIASIVDLPRETWLLPQDGVSLFPLFTSDLITRSKPIPFHCFNQTVWLDYPYKLLKKKEKTAFEYELYHLENDPRETTNLWSTAPNIAKQLQVAMESWEHSMQASIAGLDYPEGRVYPDHPEPQFWMDSDRYEPYFKTWRERPEYGPRLRRAGR